MSADSDKIFEEYQEQRLKMLKESKPFTEHLTSEDKCQCGRLKTKAHCPYCGRSKTYGYAEWTITRTHPQTGILYRDIRMYRCEKCGRQFDDFQWFYECHAPLEITAQRKLVKTLTAEEHTNRALSGVKYDENDKRHFKKMTGVEYDEVIAAWQDVQKKKAKLDLEKAANKISHASPIGGVKHKEVKLTPLQAHIETCNYCITHDDHCEVGKQLIVAEAFGDPFKEK